MSEDDMAFEYVLAALQEYAQRAWHIINETFIKPLRRWFRTTWPRIARAVRRAAYLMCYGRRPRHRNARIQMVQAKRARLMLPPSGKYLGMTRRASYVLAYARTRG